MSILLELLGLGIGLTILIGLWIVIKWLSARTEYESKRDKFDWYYTKHLLAYKIKVLQDELKNRNVKLEDIHEIISDALSSKTSKKHVLDEVEEEVKGEVEEVSPKTSSQKNRGSRNAT